MSKRNTVITCISVAAVALLVAAVFGYIRLSEYNEQQRLIEQTRLEQEAIQDAYIKANYAFRLTTGLTDAEHRQREGIYLSFGSYVKENQYGVAWHTYLALKYYDKITGIVITYDVVTDYLSEEYESDGTLRLYNNGRHPEIEAYVDWMWQRREMQIENPLSAEEINRIAPGYAPGALIELKAFMWLLEQDYYAYFSEHQAEGFVGNPFNTLSPQMYDELVRKEADPDYEMDLLSLQQQGY